MVVAAITLALAQVPTETETIQMHHIRPSVVVKHLKEFYFRGDGPTWLVNKVDDEHGTLTLAGAPDEVRDIKRLISEFDVRRRTVAVTLTVDSKIDFLHYQVSSKMPEFENWSTSEDETKSNFVITPRLNDDNTVTLKCTYRHGESSKADLVFRVGANKPFDLAKAIARAMPDEKIPAIQLEAHMEAP